MYYYFIYDGERIQTTDLCELTEKASLMVPSGTTVKIYATRWEDLKGVCLADFPVTVPDGQPFLREGWTSCYAAGCILLKTDGRGNLHCDRKTEDICPNTGQQKRSSTEAEL